jgi:predicted RNA-binding protein YlxR (DUF448 family)/ribosomal protein L30E
MLMSTTDQTKKISERTCVGCGRTGARGDLLRVVLGADRSIAVDIRGGAGGRGAHVHPRLDCLEKACKSGFKRAFKCDVQASLGEVSEQIIRSYDRRIAGLLMGARRAGALAIGTDAAIESLVKGRAALVVVACNAGSIAKGEAVGRAVAEGKATAWKTKAELGALLGRDEVGIVAVLSGDIAEQIGLARSRSEACRRLKEVPAWDSPRRCPEVR